MHMSAHKWIHVNSRERCNVAGQDRRLIRVNWWLMNGRTRHQCRAATTKGESIWHRSLFHSFSLLLWFVLSPLKMRALLGLTLMTRCWAGGVEWQEVALHVCLCDFMRMCWCDGGKSIPTVMRKVPTAPPSGIEKTFSFSLHSVLFHPLHFSSSVHLLLLQYHPFWHFRMM